LLSNRFDLRTVYGSRIKVEPGALDGLVLVFCSSRLWRTPFDMVSLNCENEGLVEASARCDGHSLHLLVRDTGSAQVAHQQAGHGIGLKNTRERLTHFYREEYEMKAGALRAGGFESGDYHSL